MPGSALHYAADTRWLLIMGAVSLSVDGATLRCCPVVIKHFLFIAHADITPVSARHSRGFAIPCATSAAEYWHWLAVWRGGLCHGQAFRERAQCLRHNHAAAEGLHWAGAPCQPKVFAHAVPWHTHHATVLCILCRIAEWTACLSISHMLLMLTFVLGVGDAMQSC